MAKLCGTVILEDSPSFEQIHQGEFHRILCNWGAQHGNPYWQYVVDRPGNSLAVTGVRASHAYVDQKEIGPSGRLWIGPFRAYLGDFQYVPEEEAPKTPQEAFNFPQEILRFFEQMQFTEEERNKVLDMPLRDFLGTCKEAAGQLSSHNPPTDTQAPWILSKRMMMSSKVKCPACEQGILRLIDGRISCPICGKDFGDIDDLPDA